MVKIRLKRMGTTKRPVYRLVVADSRSPRDGRFIEAIGFYDPLPNPAVVRIDEEKVRTWMRRGARPSESARDLLIRQGVLAASVRPVRAAAAGKKAEEPAPTTASATATPPATATATGEAPPPAASDEAAPEETPDDDVTPAVEDDAQ